jgi:hypothetical protein
MRGEGGVTGPQLYTGAQINFGDLTPFLTYGLLLLTWLSFTSLPHAHSQSLLAREYGMTYRGHTIRLLSPSPYSQVSKLDLQHTRRLRKRGNLLKAGKSVEGGGRGAESYDRKKPGPLKSFSTFCC